MQRTARSCVPRHLYKTCVRRQSTASEFENLQTSGAAANDGRRPDRVYNISVAPSRALPQTTFPDWSKRNLVQLNRAKIAALKLKNSVANSMQTCGLYCLFYFGICRRRKQRILTVVKASMTIMCIENDWQALRPSYFYPPQAVGFYPIGSHDDFRPLNSDLFLKMFHFRSQHFHWLMRALNLDGH